jgi:hypothetical protein
MVDALGLRLGGHQGLGEFIFFLKMEVGERRKEKKIGLGTAMARARVERAGSAVTNFDKYK